MTNRRYTQTDIDRQLAMLQGAYHRAGKDVTLKLVRDGRVSTLYVDGFKHSTWVATASQVWASLFDMRRAVDVLDTVAYTASAEDR